MPNPKSSTNGKHLRMEAEVSPEVHKKLKVYAVLAGVSLGELAGRMLAGVVSRLPDHVPLSSASVPGSLPGKAED